MGKGRAIKYIVRATTVDFGRKCTVVHEYPWPLRKCPTNTDMEAWRDGINDSITLPHGPNHHLHKMFAPYSRCQAVLQKTGTVVAEYNPPAFEEVKDETGRI